MKTLNKTLTTLETKLNLVREHIINNAEDIIILLIMTPGLCLSVMIMASCEDFFHLDNFMNLILLSLIVLAIHYIVSKLIYKTTVKIIDTIKVIRAAASA